MQKTLLMFLLAATSITSNALTSDRFQCTFEIYDLINHLSTSNTQSFFVSRLPISVPTDFNGKITAGQMGQALRLETHEANINASMSLYYKQSLKLDPSGQPLEARQLTCFSVSGSICRKGNPLCSQKSIACAEPGNPQDPTFGWTPTAIVNGEPAFLEAGMGESLAKIFDDKETWIATIHTKCSFTGTYQ